MASIRNLNHHRTQAQNILNRAQNDPDFLSRLVAQPVDTLQESGLSLAEAREFSQELGTAEVVGYMPPRQTYCAYTCDRYTCWVTWCGNMPYSN